MKIEGPGKTQSTGSKKKAAQTSGADGAFSDFLTEKTEGQSPAAASSSITAADVLLSVQASDDPAQRSARRRMTDRADRILDKLERIRLSMLSGTLTIGDMIDVADMVARHRERIDDPALTAILDEIDLRAQIELAKMRVSLDASSQHTPS